MGNGGSIRRLDGSRRIAAHERSGVINALLGFKRGQRAFAKRQEDGGAMVRLYRYAPAWKVVHIPGGGAKYIPGKEAAARLYRYIPGDEAYVPQGAADSPDQ